MRTITLRIRSFQIAAIITAVHRWLDARGFMPAALHYDIGDDKMLVVKMEFAADHEADAFAGAFRRATVDRVRSRRDDRSERGR